MATRRVSQLPKNFVVQNFSTYFYLSVDYWQGVVSNY